METILTWISVIMALGLLTKWARWYEWRHRQKCLEATRRATALARARDKTAAEIMAEGNQPPPAPNRSRLPTSGGGLRHKGADEVRGEKPHAPGRGASAAPPPPSEATAREAHAADETTRLAAQRPPGDADAGGGDDELEAKTQVWDRAALEQVVKASAADELPELGEDDRQTDAEGDRKTYAGGDQAADTEGGQPGTDPGEDDIHRTHLHLEKTLASASWGV